MIGFMNLFANRFGVSMKNNRKEYLKGVALWVFIFGKLSLLVFFNYFEVKETLNHKFN